MHGTRRVKDCFLTDLRGTARLKIDQNEKLVNSKEAEKFFFQVNTQNSGYGSKYFCPIGF